MGNVGTIFPLTLREIAKLGIDGYQRILYFLLFDKNSIEDKDFVKKVDEENLSDFDVTFLLCVLDENFKRSLLDSFEIIFKDKPSFCQDGFFYFGEPDEKRIIDNSNFDEIRSIVRKQNMLENKNYKPKNKKAEKLKEFFLNKRKELKGEKDGGLTLDRIISIVASNSPSLNFITIWDYTICELYEHFNQMMKRDGFEQQWSLVLQGADIKSSDLKHWAT